MGTTSLPTRVDKTLQWLETSRDSWREKTKKTKADLKKKTLAVKRARDGRDRAQRELEETLCRLQEHLVQKDQEIERLKTQLEQIKQREEILKKKHLSLMITDQGTTPSQRL